MELRELAQPEQKYTYRQSHQLDAQTGCIGYLRGDFGTTGKEFYSSWFDSMAYLKTPEFQAELDRVINALREDSQYSGILADRSSLSNACRQSTARKFGRDEFGFRLNTQDYAYLLRLNPNRGEYNCSSASSFSRVSSRASCACTLASRFFITISHLVFHFSTSFSNISYFPPLIFIRLLCVQLASLEYSFVFRAALAGHGQ